MTGVVGSTNATIPDVERGKRSFGLYWGTRFHPLALTQCPECGHVDYWALDSKVLGDLNLDESARPYYDPIIRFYYDPVKESEDS